MLRLIANWFVSAIALFLVPFLVPGIYLNGFSAALLAVLAISLINIILKPILILLTLPINLLTLGLFTFVINALLFSLAGKLVPGFTVDGFMSAIIGSIVYSLISSLLRIITRSD